MAAGDVASISGLDSVLRSDCDDILRRKVSSAREAAWDGGNGAGPLFRFAISIPPSIEFYHVLELTCWIFGSVIGLSNRQGG